MLALVTELEHDVIRTSLIAAVLLAAYGLSRVSSVSTCFLSVWFWSIGAGCVVELPPARHAANNERHNSRAPHCWSNSWSVSVLFPFVTLTSDGDILGREDKEHLDDVPQQHRVLWALNKAVESFETASAVYVSTITFRIFCSCCV